MCFLKVLEEVEKRDGGLEREWRYGVYSGGLLWGIGSVISGDEMRGGRGRGGEMDLVG